MKDVLYMKVTADKYELPIAVADTAVELAKMVGVTPNSVHRAIHLTNIGAVKKSKYIKVVLQSET